MTIALSMAAVSLLKGNVGDFVRTWVLTDRDYEDFSLIAPTKNKEKKKNLTHSTTRVALFTPLLSLDGKVVVSPLAEDSRNLCNSSHVSTTHVIMEGFRFAGVVTCLSPLRCSAIQVPEHTVGQDRSWSKQKPHKQPLDMFTGRLEHWLLPPPGM